ncbi:carbohydrate ABC transporter permease [Petroclostridium xylanilyticum]|jgi:ABC-type sugar transport system permease subunit|uniref:carbohydrate ABC transporter permease n=1 Tax=Petroclostridium xylanilyticum TaxID=1792311 RepID=UPI000B99A3D6|nr:sugar ABC transporter permease [Petroclostridium xylanilyticum]
MTEKKSKSKKGKAIIQRNRITAYCFLLPNFIGFFIFTFIPVLAAFVLSFMQWDSANPAKFIGLKNFELMFKDSSFIISFWNTICYTFTTVPLTIIVALALAVALNNGVKGITVFRAIHFFPHVASIVAISVVWQFLYNADFGPINMFLKTMGINDPPRWTASVQWAMPAVIIMSVWKSAGYYMVMFLSGLKSISNQLYEAATIDGANAWEKFWSITLPMLSPTMFFVVIMCLINSFKVFDQIYIMTEGGPGRATSVLVYQIYSQAFINFKFGYASAMALILFLIIFIITFIQFRFQEKWVNYTN